MFLSNGLQLLKLLIFRFQISEFPWMVAILKEETAGEQLLNVYQCGGSMINRNVILTGDFNI